MVLVENLSDDSSSSSANSSQRTSSNTNTSPGSASASSTSTNSSSGLIGFLMQDKISAVLLFTRMFTFVSTIMFIVPIFGFDVNVLYQKALMSSAATSALKLHQRMLNLPFQLSREYLARLILEDSFHYLLYSLIFLNSHPVTIILMPIAAFAILHVSAYLRTMLSVMSVAENAGIIRKPLNAVITRDKDIMKFVALCEIMLMPTIFLMILSGKSGIFVPFVYYRFVCMRYSSRRNPYSRVMFHELRVGIEQYTSQASCPQMIKNLSQRAINLIIRFAPPQMA